MINDLLFSNIVLKQDLVNDKKDLRLCQKSSAVSSGMDQSSHGIYTLFALYVHKQ